MTDRRQVVHIETITFEDDNGELITLHDIPVPVSLSVDVQASATRQPKITAWYISGTTGILCTNPVEATQLDEGRKER